MIDFNRIYCDLHPNELITNFCCKDQCHVGLCATCICLHTQMHIQKKTAPQYQNIRTTYSRMQDNIRSKIANFQQEKTRVNNVIQVIKNKRKHITQTIQQARQQTIDFINKFYQNKQKQILRKIQSDQKKMGLHNQNRMQSLLNIISRDINSLFTSAQDLNSQAFLQSYHRIRTQTLVNCNKTYSQVHQQVQKNQNYQVNIHINNNYINQIKSSLERSIHLYFGQKRKQQKQIKSTLHSYKPSKTNNFQMPTTYSKDIISQPQSQNNIPQFQRSDFNKNQYIKHQSRIIQPKRNQSIINVNPNITKSYVNCIPSSPINYYQRPNQSFIQTMVQPVQRPLIRNNSFQILQSNPNHQNYSRMEIRGNSGQRAFKENVLNRSSIMTPNPSYMQSGHQGTGQLTRKSRKGGLTLLKSNDQFKSQS